MIEEEYMIWLNKGVCLGILSILVLWKLQR